MAKSATVTADLKATTAIVSVELTSSERAISKEIMEAQAEHRKGSDRLAKAVPAMAELVKSKGFPTGKHLYAPKVKGLKQSGKTDKSALTSIEEWFTLQSVVHGGLKKAWVDLLEADSEVVLSTEEKALRDVLVNDRQTVINNVRAYMLRAEAPKKKGPKNAKADLKTFVLKQVKLCIARIQDNTDDDSLSDMVEVKEALETVISKARA